MSEQEQFFLKQQGIYRLHQLIDGLVAAIAPGRPFEFTEELAKRMHGVAMSGLLETAGKYRQSEVQILNSPHKCPSWVDVPAHMGTFCAYLRTNWEKRDLVHLSSFALWRLNWIHPFADGNGRTSRASAYLVLCAKHGRAFPPKNSIVEQIERNKDPYNALLRKADDIMAQTSDINASLREMELYIGGMLKEQLKANF